MSVYGTIPESMAQKKVFWEACWFEFVLANQDILTTLSPRLAAKQSGCQQESNNLLKLLSSVTSFGKIREVWSINQMSIGCASRLCLRIASPLTDHHCQGTLGFSVCRDLTCIAVTNANILTSQRSTVSYDPASLRWERSPTTPPPKRRNPCLRY